jgi:hypothetical protein
MTIVEMLKKMGGSDERMSRAIWNNKAWVQIDHDSGQMFFSAADIVYGMPWIPSCGDILANDWNYWSMP